MGYILRANSGWGYLYYNSKDLEATDDKSKATVYPSEQDAASAMTWFKSILHNIQHEKPEVIKESKMKTLKQYISESRKYGNDAIDFDNVPGGLRLYQLSDGISVSVFSGGSGYGNQGQDRWVDGAGREKDRWHDCEKIIRDLIPVCDRFDREVESVLKKYGYSKK